MKKPSKQTKWNKALLKSMPPARVVRRTVGHPKGSEIPGMPGCYRVQPMA